MAERPDLEAMNICLDTMDAEGWSDHAPLDYLTDSLRATIDYAAALEREAGEREAHYEAMYQRQADAVRYHTDRADKLAARLAQAEREWDAAEEKAADLFQQGIRQIDAYARELREAQALIVTWATWLRFTFPKELEVGAEEQALLDYAACLAAARARAEGERESH